MTSGRPPSRSPSLALALAALALASGCDGSSGSGNAGGLPPAADWKAPPPMATGGGPASASAAGAVVDPHAGLDMGGDGMGAAGDPHAGLDMGGGMPAGDPHAGLDMGGGAAAAVDPAMAQPAPDPDRPIDPGRFLRGSITATDATRAAIKPGAILFLSVKPIDPTSGDVIGGPLAVDRLDVRELPIAFDLTEEHVMVAGTQFRGDVVVTARVDGDGEARTREAGDVEGSVRTRVPSAGLSLVLDRRIP